jgi:aryl-alcohol dehydrogenase-like predicted oxidoreductase
MRTRILGSTGLVVSEIGLGLAALGRPAYIDLGRGEDLGPDRNRETMERRAHDVLDAAARAGIRYIDAARSYGDAEAFLASWLKLRTPTDITVGSKWGYTYTGGWRIDADVQEVKDHSLEALRRQLSESTALLGHHLDLYQVHSATLESGVLEDLSVLAELNLFRSRGIAVGLSVSGPRQADTILRALEVAVDGVNPFQSVQATWNILEPSSGDALLAAHQAGWGVIVKEALANGRLAGRPAALRVVEHIAGRHHATADQVALAAVLANPWADVVLSGAVTVDQLESNVAATAIELEAQELAELLRSAEPAELYWRTRAALAWA